MSEGLESLANPFAVWKINFQTIFISLILKIDLGYGWLDQSLLGVHVTASLL